MNSVTMNLIINFIKKNNKKIQKNIKNSEELEEYKKLYFYLCYDTIDDKYKILLCKKMIELLLRNILNLQLKENKADTQKIKSRIKRRIKVWQINGMKN